MKKKILPLFLLLCTLLLLIGAVGCDANPPSTDAETTTEPPNEIMDPTEYHTIPLTNQLIKTIKDYLIDSTMQVLLNPSTFSMRLDPIKSGEEQLLQVTFDPNEYYYACIYFDYPEDHSKGHELFMYCCTDEYTFVGFENEEDIPETYGGKAFFLAFQVNKAQSCTNVIVENGETCDVQYYQAYFPQFENGFNTAPATHFNETYFYSMSPEWEIVYKTKRHYDRNPGGATFPHVLLDGKYYITQIHYTVYHSGSRSDRNLAYEFGAYYDELMEVMITDKYSVYHENESILEQFFNEHTVYYGLFDLEDLKTILTK